MLSLLLVGLAGLCAGAALGARKNGAPVVFAVGFLVLAAAAGVLAVLSFSGND